MTLAALVGIPVVLGLLSFLIEDIRIDLGLLLSCALAHLGLTASLWLWPPPEALAPLLAVDGPGRLFLTLASFLFLMASLYSVPYVLDGTHDERAAPHRFVPCLCAFLAAMTLVAATQHLALMWVAIEATTLASAPLVYFYKRRPALEATWKYLLLCSVGIALALLGTFFLGIAASDPGRASPGLSLPELTSAAPHMSRPWLQAAFVLALVGYGTKMGLAPLHTWLPDTHSQAPSPVSALLSGALLNCAFLGILRFYQVCLASGDPAFAQHLLVAMGFFTILVATSFMLGQSDYKRLFAYSSVENMGILAAGVGLGGSATYGAMLHAVNHSVCKAGLFFLAGNLLRSYGSTRAVDVRGALGRLPVTGTLLLLLLLAIGGLPPFGPFISELLIFRAALDAHAWLGVLFAALVAIAFLGTAGVLLPILQGQTAPEPAPREARLTVLAPALLAVISLILGLWVPPFLSDALHETAGIFGG
jgi:hydrogenase-4 component F